jgi:hypothetical protein
VSVPYLVACSPGRIFSFTLFISAIVQVQPPATQLAAASSLLEPRPLSPKRALTWRASFSWVLPRP